MEMTENEAIKVLKQPCLCDYDLSATIESCDISKCDRREAVMLAIKALEDVQRYRENEKELLSDYRQACKEAEANARMYNDYLEAGTVEECRDAVERLKAKRPDGGRDIDGKDYLICPNCCAIVADGEWTAKFCPDCGQKLDWSGEE